MSRADDANAGGTPHEGARLGHRGPVHVLLLAHATSAALTAAYLWSVSGPGIARSLGTLTLLAAAASSLALGLLALRQRSDLRRAIISVQGLLVPLQFALSVLSDVALLGMMLSIAILALLRPTFPRMSQGARKLFLALHVGVSVSWLGVSMAMAVLSLTGSVTRDAGLRHHCFALMHVLDLALVIPLVLLSIASGLVVSLGTHWGLVRHWWIVIKFALSAGIVTVAGVWESHWVRGLAAPTSSDRGPGLEVLEVRLASCMIGFSIALWAATILSIYKPWGKTPWAGRRR